MIAAAPGTIPEFQIRVLCVRSSADFTLVVVRLIPHLPVDAPGFPLKINDVFLPLYLAPPQQIANPLSAEQEVVQQRHQRQQVGGEGSEQNTQAEQHCVDDGKPFDFHRNQEEQQQVRVRIEGRIGEEHGQVHIVHGHDSAFCRQQPHQCTVHNGQHRAAKKVNGKLSGAPCILQCIADEVIHIQPEHEIPPKGFRYKQERNQPPDLSVSEHHFRGERQHIGQTVGGIHHGKKPHRQIADDNHQHQPGNPEIRVAPAKPINSVHQFFQGKTSCIGHFQVLYHNFLRNTPFYSFVFPRNMLY